MNERKRNIYGNPPPTSNVLRVQQTLFLFMFYRKGRIKSQLFNTPRFCCQTIHFSYQKTFDEQHVKAFKFS